MSPFLLYIARASLYLAIFYAFYLLVMRRTSLFRFNRIALLFGTVACHLLPLLRLRTVLLPETVSVQIGELEMVGDPVGASAPFPWLPVVYAAGVLAIVTLSLVSVARTRKIICSGARLVCEGCLLTLVDRDIPSFSWGRHIVMSRADYERHPVILAHEMEHVQKHHSLDVLLMTAVAAMHWFNPLVWIARAELRLLHEYEADEGLIRKGIDATSYQLLLVRKAVGEQRFSLANGFNHAKLKQRITMMQHKPTSGWMRLAYSALLPILSGAMFLCNPVRAQVQNSTVPPMGVIIVDKPAAVPDTTGKAAVPYAQIERKPTFQGEDAGTFGLWVAQNINYPEEAKSDGIQGRVMVQFTIYEDGSIRDAKVLRGVHPSLDAEAIRVILASPKWEPGYQDGKPVRVTFQFPAVFKLTGNETPKNEAAAPAIFIRTSDGTMPIIYLDGKKFNGNFSDIDPSTIDSMEILKDQATVEKYGAEAQNGIILITSKK